jgi:hypothetical protein
MQMGDLVRFRICTWHRDPKQYTAWKEGLIFEEYKSWEKVVSILHEGETIRVHASDVQLVSRAPQSD